MTKRICASVVLLVLLLPACALAQTVSVVRLLHNTPMKAWASYNRGAGLLAKGAMEQSILELERAVAIDPGFPEAHCDLGVIYMVMNRTADAAAEFRRAVQLDPAVSAYHNNLGVSLAVLGRPDESEAEARRALALNPSSPQAQFLLGELLASRPETRAAAEAHLAYASRQIPEAREALDRLRAGKSAPALFQP